MSLYHHKISIATIILAAGKGTRMKSALPKTLQPIAYKPILFHVVDTARAINPEQIIAVVNNDMLPYLENTDLSLAIQEKQLGTANAVAAGLTKLNNQDSKILILYGDVPLIEQSTLNNLLNLDADIAVLTFHADNPTGYGRIITKGDDLIEKIVEQKDTTAKEALITLCNSGIMALNAKLAKELLAIVDNNNSSNEFYLTDIISIANQKNLRCRYITCSQEELQGINTFEQLSNAEIIYQQRKAKALMDNGVHLIMPHTIYFAHDTKIAPNVTIHPNVVFAPNVTIDQYSIIFPFSHLNGVTIGKNCKIGPFARIRPNSSMEDNSSIGNFVEIKNSKLSQKVKAQHLSYIGDSNIGSNSNVGAGVITCNYDGYNKYQTNIGENVFIGSNTALIAPLTIENNAIIGAGSVINSDVKQDELALSRAKQKNIKKGSLKIRLRHLKNNK